MWLVLVKLAEKGTAKYRRAAHFRLQHANAIRFTSNTTPVGSLIFSSTKGYYYARLVTRHVLSGTFCRMTTVCISAMTGLSASCISPGVGPSGISTRANGSRL